MICFYEGQKSANMTRIGSPKTPRHDTAVYIHDSAAHCNSLLKPWTRPNNEKVTSAE